MAYVWQRWLARELRAAGLKVVEVQGWENRGRPASTGSFNPRGQITNHHTGTKTSASRPMPTLQTLIRGRSDLPGPLAQVGVGYDGTVYVIAAGRANHAGRVGKSGVAGMPNGADGNALAIGDEIDTNGTQVMPKAQRDAVATVNAVVIRHYDRGTSYVHRHQDISGTGKWDLGSRSTSQLRSDAAAEVKRLASPPKPEPKPVTTHTRWATKTTGVYDAPNGKKLRDLTAGDRFEVIDGSGHGKGGWVETTFHNWVDGNDTATEEPKAVTSHTRWAVRVTGVHETKGGEKLRDLQPGESFKVIDGSGHGNGGWIETTHHNWVLGEDTSTSDPDAKARLSVMTHNVWNGRNWANDVLPKLNGILGDHKPDVPNLQECYKAPDLVGKVPGYAYRYQGHGYPPKTEGYVEERADNIILVRDGIAVKATEAYEMTKSWAGPKVGAMHDPRVFRRVTVNKDGQNFRVVNVHGPFTAAARKEFLTWARAEFEELAALGDPVIFIGDWNIKFAELVKAMGPLATVDGGAPDMVAYANCRKVGSKNLGLQGSDTHDCKIFEFEAS